MIYHQNDMSDGAKSHKCMSESQRPVSQQDPSVGQKSHIQYTTVECFFICMPVKKNHDQIVLW